MRNASLWRALLGVEKTVIEEIKFDEDEAVVVAHVRPVRASKGWCGACGTRAPWYNHGEGRRRWRGLDLGTTLVFLEADSPRVNCPTHGPTVRQVPWARHAAGHTLAFDQQVAWLATQIRICNWHHLIIASNTYSIHVMFGLYDVEIEPEVKAWLESLSDRDFGRVDFLVGLLAERAESLSEPYARHLGGKVRELRFSLLGQQTRVTYWLAPSRRVVLLTVFRKTRRAEAGEVGRALKAQRVCEARHGVAHDTFEREEH